MRWPWQRREAVTTSTSGVPSRAERSPGGEPVSPMGWAFHPPLQRQIADMPLVTRPDRFPSQLPAWRDPSFTGTLAHRVSPEAPAGVIDGDGGGAAPSVRSVTADLTLLAPSPVRATAAVQRRPASTLEPTARQLTTASDEGMPRLVVESHDALLEEPVLGAPPDGGRDTYDDEPASSPEPAGVDRAVQRSATPATAPQPAPASTPEAAGSSVRPSRDLPLLGRHDHAVPPVIPSEDLDGPAGGLPSVDAPAPDPAPTSRPAGASRRLGLGAPLASLPPSADGPVQRQRSGPGEVSATSPGLAGFTEVDIAPVRPRGEPVDASTGADHTDTPPLGAKPGLVPPPEGSVTGASPDPPPVVDAHDAVPAGEDGPGGPSGPSDPGDPSDPSGPMPLAPVQRASADRVEEAGTPAPRLDGASDDDHDAPPSGEEPVGPVPVDVAEGIDEHRPPTDPLDAHRFVVSAQPAGPAEPGTPPETSLLGHGTRPSPATVTPVQRASAEDRPSGDDQPSWLAGGHTDDQRAVGRGTSSPSASGRKSLTEPEAHAGPAMVGRAVQRAEVPGVAPASRFDGTPPPATSVTGAAAGVVTTVPRSSEPASNPSAAPPLPSAQTRPTLGQHAALRTLGRHHLDDAQVQLHDADAAVPRHDSDAAMPRHDDGAAVQRHRDALVVQRHDRSAATDFDVPDRGPTAPISSENRTRSSDDALPGPHGGAPTAARGPEPPAMAVPVVQRWWGSDAGAPRSTAAPLPTRPVAGKIGPAMTSVVPSTTAPLPGSAATALPDLPLAVQATAVETFSETESAPAPWSSASTASSTLQRRQGSSEQEPVTASTDEPSTAEAPVAASDTTVETTTGGTTTAETTAAPGAGTGNAQSPEQMEALAQKLFAPLMRRIRSEMLLDRERRGLRTDAW